MLRAADTVCKTDTGRQRRGNEDSAYVRAPLFVVADGMGGAQAGEVASALAVEEFQRPLADDGHARAASRRPRAVGQPAHLRDRPVGPRAGRHGHDADRGLSRRRRPGRRPRRRQPRLHLPRRIPDPAHPGPFAGRGARAARQADRGAGRRASAALDHHPGARHRERRGGRHVDVPGARRRRRADVLGRAHVDDRRGPDHGCPGLRARPRPRRRAADRRGQRGRRTRQHHGRPVPLGGRRRRGRGRSADRGGACRAAGRVSAGRSERAGTGHRPRRAPPSRRWSGPPHRPGCPPPTPAPVHRWRAPRGDRGATPPTRPEPLVQADRRPDLGCDRPLPVRRWRISGQPRAVLHRDQQRRDRHHLPRPTL